MNTRLLKNRIAIIVFLLLFFVSVNAQTISIKPFVAFPNEEIILTLDGVREIERVVILASFDQRKLEKCTENCPVFENNSFEISNLTKNTHKILTNNASTGNYVIRIDYVNGSKVFSSFAIKQNFAIFILPVLAVLIALLIGVERNVFKV